jgi:hypothetical protein
LDVKPLFDKEENSGRIDRSKDKDNPHYLDPDDKMDDATETQRYINIFISSFTTIGGTTIVIDNREGQENFYLCSYRGGYNFWARYAAQVL